MRRLFPAFAKKPSFLSAIAFTAATFLAPSKAQAGPAGELLEERYHAALSEVTQKVRKTEDPAEKRRILKDFFDHMEAGLGKAANMSELSDAERRSLHTVIGKYYAYESELQGTDGYKAVADADLDEFAGYVRQGMEQAPVGGGVYISAGALLVILLILILLF